MVTDPWFRELLAAMELPAYKEVENPVIEPAAKGERNEERFFIKFMSDKGTYDKLMGSRFKRWLILANVPFKQTNERSFIVSQLLFEASFGKKVFED